MNKKLKCPFCESHLVNASFVSPTSVFVYLTCWNCHKRVIIDRDDYEEVVK
jgi:transcription elongation factor Elf1